MARPIKDLINKLKEKDQNKMIEFAVVETNGELVCMDIESSAYQLGELMSMFSNQTPAARWRTNGEQDPHGDQYNCKREDLTMGNLTDDEMANAVYLDPNIGNLTAAKERIRWLSRELEKLTQEREIRESREDVLTMIAENLKVDPEPHQTFFERLIEASENEYRI